MNNTITLWQLFSLFFKIGCTAFGGFMALIAAVENQVVKKKKWLTPEEMLDTVSLATILVGPVAVNTVAYVGYRLRGVLGTVCCMLGVILPAFLLMLALSYAYFEFGSIPAVSKIFMGFIPSVCAIILVAAINMGKKAVADKFSLILCVSSLALMVAIPHFMTSLGIILASGIIGYTYYKSKIKIKEENLPDVKNPSLKQLFFSPLLIIPFVFSSSALSLLLTFGSMSLIMFGGGYVFVPLIQASVVDSHAWLTQQEFIDAIAMSQIMPGPIVLSTVFIGYKVAGILGAVSATLGIFVPPAILMLVAGSYLHKIKESKLINSALKGVRPSVVGLIASAAVSIGFTAQPTLTSVAIFSATILAMLKFKVDVAFIIPVAGVIGYLVY